jgi:hypothetical protein
VSPGSGDTGGNGACYLPPGEVGLFAADAAGTLPYYEVPWASGRNAVVVRRYEGDAYYDSHIYPSKKERKKERKRERQTDRKKASEQAIIIQEEQFTL